MIQRDEEKRRRNWPSGPKYLSTLKTSISCFLEVLTQTQKTQLWSLIMKLTEYYNPISFVLFFFHTNTHIFKRIDELCR